MGYSPILVSMSLSPPRPDATLQLAAHASVVVFAILAVCGLLDIAHVYIEDIFIGGGFWQSGRRVIPCITLYCSGRRTLLWCRVSCFSLKNETRFGVAR